MSVTFQQAPVFTGRSLIVTVGDEGDFKTLASFASYAEAEAAFLATVGNGDRWDFFIQAEALFSDAPEMNVSNGNAMDVLMALGFDAEAYCGSEDSETFHARVLVALAENRIDAGLPTFTDGGNGSATIVHCGREAGYVTDKLERLLVIAEFALANGQNVQWS